MRGFLRFAVLAAIAACTDRTTLYVTADAAAPDTPPLAPEPPTPPPVPPAPPPTPPPASGPPTVTVLSSTVGVPRGLALDATDVYWSNHDAGSILHCAKTGCGGTPTVVATAPNPWRIALDAMNVYWTSRESGTVMQCPKSGCGASPTVLATGQMLATAIAVDAGFVYWVAEGEGAVRRCAIGGCGGTPTNILVGKDIRTVAVDETNLYLGGIALYVCPKSGCPASPTLVAPVAISDSYYDVQSIALDDANIYWVEPQRVVRCPKTGCPDGPTFISETNGDAHFVAITPTNVYWTTGTEGLNPGVYRCPMGTDCGAKPIGIASGDYLHLQLKTDQIFLTADVAADEKGVYAANLDGSVFVMVEN